jgi:GNAT superfamily N-acetyltransferase
MPPASAFRVAVDLKRASASIAFVNPDVIAKLRVDDTLSPPTLTTSFTTATAGRKSGWQYNVEGRQRFCQTVSKRSNWLVRDYAPGDENDILALCRRVFGPTWDLEDWRWRTFENPAGKALIVIAQEKIGEQIVGHVAGIATDLKVGDFFRKGFFLVDSVVDPSHRGRGINAGLTLTLSFKCCERDGGFGFGLPNKQAYLPTLKVAATHILTLPCFFKPLDWLQILQSWLRPGFRAKPIPSPVRSFEKDRQPTFVNGFRVEEICQFGDKANDLWQTISPQFAIAAVRDADHLNWRYFEHPNSPYRVFSVSRTGEWKGYIVTRMLEKWGLRLGTIVDLFFDTDCPLAGKLLLRQAALELRQQGADALWGLFAAPRIYQRLLRKAGFFKSSLKWTERPFHLVADFVTFEQLRPDLAVRDLTLLRQADQWFLSLADTDLA